MGSGNNPDMEERTRRHESAGIESAGRSAAWIEGVWTEAAGVVQSDQDADLRLEARGLMVAEMAEVELAERWLATRRGHRIRVLVRGGTWVRGRINFAAADHLVVDCPARLILPRHAICAVASLPHVLHQDPAPSGSWRSTLRDHLGTAITVTVGGQTPQGRLTWVGRDHISIDQADGELTVRWPAIDSVAIRAGSQPRSDTSDTWTG